MSAMLPSAEAGMWSSVVGREANIMEVARFLGQSGRAERYPYTYL